MAFSLINWIKGVTSRMFGKNAFQQAGMDSVISDEVAKAIEHWRDLYYNRVNWGKKQLSLGLPSLIAREMATLVTLEAQINVGCETETLNPRAELIKDLLDKVADELSLRVEYACAFGGLVFKPYVTDEKICIDYVSADCFYPVTFNSKGEITEAIFVEKKHIGSYDYSRVERHKLEGKEYTITNKAFKANTSTGKSADSDLGDPVPLTEVDDWKDIEPEVTISNMERMLFAYFRLPLGNVININSNLGVSIYAKADKAGLLKEADLQFQRLMWEYEGGELAIDASSQAFKPNSKGEPILPSGCDRLYRINDIDSSGELMKTFSPALRDSSYYTGLNTMLMRIEDVCGIARGTISDVNDTARTATEIKVSRQRTYATVTTIQRALQKAIDDLAGAVDALITLYQLAPDGDYELAYVWDDSVIVDADTERQRDMEEVSNGLMMPWEFRVKWYGETEEQAKEAITEAQHNTAINELLRQPLPEEE